jgi:D-alanyl-D-alanine dipeptidase
MHFFSFMIVVLLFSKVTIGSIDTSKSFSRYSSFEKKLLRQGMIDIKSLAPDIQVDLKYTDPANFMKTDVYSPSLRHCFLQRSAASKLVKANNILKRQHSDLRLLVVDGLRPRHIQRRMWKYVRKTPMRSYVAEPSQGSMHNYGCAVDITIVDTSGNRLDMGTPVDHFGYLSQPRLEKYFFDTGKLTSGAVANRRLLRHVMLAAGFHSIPIEWWHFEAFEKKTIRSRYKIIE